MWTPLCAVVFTDSSPACAARRRFIPAFSFIRRCRCRDIRQLDGWQLSGRIATRAARREMRTLFQQLNYYNSTIKSEQHDSPTSGWIQSWHLQMCKIQQFIPTSKFQVFLCRMFIGGENLHLSFDPTPNLCEQISWRYIRGRLRSIVKKKSTVEKNISHSLAGG